MRVDYYVGLTHVSEWVCFEHRGYALQKAHAWWRERSNAPIPDSVAAAVEMAEAGALAETLAVTVRRVAGEKYDRVTAYRLGEKPDWTRPREPGEERFDPMAVIITDESPEARAATIYDDNDIPW